MNSGIYSKAYSEMNSWMHDRLSENRFRENFNFHEIFFFKKTFQGPKGYIARMCEVHLQYGNSNKMAVLHLFRINSTLYLSKLFD